MALLPLDELPWPVFESLQWRILRDVEGLRHPLIYGDPGQKQLGLDLVAIAADDSYVALQSKQVKNFGPAAIQKAVNAFTDTTRPFFVSRFIIGVSKEVRSRQSRDKFLALRENLRPIEFELWDQRDLSMKLKAAPQIVIDYFGEDVAKAFCNHFVIDATHVASHDVVAIQEAIARTPEVTTGAAAQIEQAEKLTEQDPAAALDFVESAQKALAATGFAGHAAQHEALRASLLVSLGRGEEAIRRRMDDLWEALDQGNVNHADDAGRDIASIANKTNTGQDHLKVAQNALDLYMNPLADLPDFETLSAGTSLDRARLAALAGETALAADTSTWLADNAPNLETLANELSTNTDEHAGLIVRLRLLSAEGSNEWTSVLNDARTLKLGYGLGALVAARHARRLALQQKFQEADAAWSEASGHACLAQNWTDAARWVFSQRAFRTRWNLFASDELLPIQTSLAKRGPTRTTIPSDDDAIEYARGRLADDKPRSAAIAAQRALRDAVSLSDWEGERKARRLLANILQESDEPRLAAHHLAHAAELTAIKKLGTRYANTYLDVTHHLDATAYWIIGSAYQLIAAQADFVPDDALPLIVDSIIETLASRDAQTLIDLSHYAGSRYLGSLAALAGVAGRLTLAQADIALTHFEKQPPVEHGRYRLHDNDEAATIAAILTTHSELAERSTIHLVALLARADRARTSLAERAIADHLDTAHPHLIALVSDNNSWAQGFLASHDPAATEPAVAQKALTRLTTPLKHSPNSFDFGGGSIATRDSVLIKNLPLINQLHALTELINRSQDPRVGSNDRGSYLIAAANLTAHVPNPIRTQHFSTALDLVHQPTPSLADANDERFAHPLNVLRITGTNNSQAQAAHLAACLASTPDEKHQSRDATLSLIGDKSVSEYWVTRALQQLEEALAPDIGYLSGQGWALKSLAAILWARTTTPCHIGQRLALDPDVRVRRALATALAKASLESADQAQIQTVRAFLQKDVCHSVRYAASGS